MMSNIDDDYFDDEDEIFDDEQSDIDEDLDAAEESTENKYTKKMKSQSLRNRDARRLAARRKLEDYLEQKRLDFETIDYWD